jgi:hypothetical protein
MKRVTVLLAAGILLLAAVTLPTFRAGAQETVVTDDNLDQAVANAKTPADHEAIAAYYEKEAADNEAKAKLHHSNHKTYERYPPFRGLKAAPNMASHCDGLGKYFHEAAEQDKALAVGHREMAKRAGAETRQ